MLFDNLVLIIMSGLQASGKTTVARIIHEHSGAALIANHDIRSKLPDGSEKYSSESTHYVYDTALLLADEELKKRNPVILDAMYLSQYWRKRAYEIARKNGALPIIVNCVCPDFEKVKQRTGGRKGFSDPQAEGDDMSYYERTKAIADPLERDLIAPHIEPLIITYNTANNTIETLHENIFEVKEVVTLLKNNPLSDRCRLS